MRTAWELPLRKSRVVVMTSYADGSPVQAGDTIRKEQADALLASRLERGGGIPVPMAWSCSSAAVYAVPGGNQYPLRLIQPVQAAIRMQLPPSPYLSLPASLPPRPVVSKALGCPGLEWALGVVGSFPTIVWVQGIGPLQ